jgi:hypothetical protein
MQRAEIITFLFSNWIYENLPIPKPVTHTAYIKHNCAVTRSGRSEIEGLSNRSYWRSVQQISVCWLDIECILAVWFVISINLFAFSGIYKLALFILRRDKELYIK